MRISLREQTVTMPDNEYGDWSDLKTYLLVCQKCPATIETGEIRWTDLYKTMNELGWALIPSQHGRRVKGLCPPCRDAAAKWKPQRIAPTE